MFHYDPLRPNRVHSAPERWEFAHGAASVCVYDLQDMAFVKELPVGARPDCHATSEDNRYLYIACEDGLWIIDQRTLRVCNHLAVGHVYGTNVLPSSDTMLLHDAWGGMLILKDIADMSRIHVHKHVQVLGERTYLKTLGGKGNLIDGGRLYLCNAWETRSLFAIDIKRDFHVETWIEHDENYALADDLVVSSDGATAFSACYGSDPGCCVAVTDIEARRVIQTIEAGLGTCGLTMSWDEKLVIASNDGEDAIDVIDADARRRVAHLSARAGFEALGIEGRIQGISVGRQGEVYVYDCSGSGALVKFWDLLDGGRFAVSWRGGRAFGHCGGGVVTCGN